MTVYQKLLNLRLKGEKGLFVLIDPDKGTPENLSFQAEHAQNAGVTAILVGGSILNKDDFDRAAQSMKEALTIPLIVFPGGASQVSAFADAILFLSLISGRNPQFLIGEHVAAAPVIKQLGIEAIPTAYMLIESGGITAIEFVSNTKPIPRDQSAISIAHALAGEMLGMKLIYLEAGSGAKQTVPREMISAVAENIGIPLIVGGGIRTPEQAREAAEAGADFIVVGNALEKTEDDGLLKDIAAAIGDR